MLSDASKAVVGHKFSLHFLETEWEQIVDAWQLASWDDYRDVTRLGRKTRLSEPQRTVLWAIFEKARASLAAQKLDIPTSTRFVSQARSPLPPLTINLASMLLKDVS